MKSQTTLKKAALLAISAFIFSCSSSSGDIKSPPSSPAPYNVFTDARDNQVYKYVTIGTQVWMAQNLNYNANGCKCYNDSIVNCDVYGRLYDWNAAMSSCPTGWHLPSAEEWNALTDYAGGSNTLGTKLKAVNGWNENTNGTDSYGFSALPAGYSVSDGSFMNAGYSTDFWSAEENSQSHANSRNFSYSGKSAHSDYYNKNYGFSIRCLRD